jgi:hypothetical protein
LRWSAEELSWRSSVSLRTIRRLPAGTDQLYGVKQVTRAMEDYSYEVMDAQTANNRVGPGSNKNKQRKVRCCVWHLSRARALSTSRERRPWWRTWNDYPNPTCDALLALSGIAVIVMVFWFFMSM